MIETESITFQSYNVQPNIEPHPNPSWTLDAQTPGFGFNIKTAFSGLVNYIIIFSC